MVSRNNNYKAVQIFVAGQAWVGGEMKRVIGENLVVVFLQGRQLSQAGSFAGLAMLEVLKVAELLGDGMFLGSGLSVGHGLGERSHVAEIRASSAGNSTHRK